MYNKILQFDAMTVVAASAAQTTRNTILSKPYINKNSEDDLVPEIAKVASNTPDSSEYRNLK